MANIIKIKRGLSTNLTNLQCGELALTTDDNKIFIGTESENIEISTANNVIQKDNFTEYISTSDYNPATKKYVDDLFVSNFITNPVVNSETNYKISPSHTLIGTKNGFGVIKLYLTCVKSTGTVDDSYIQWIDNVPQCLSVNNSSDFHWQFYPWSEEPNGFPLVIRIMGGSLMVRGGVEGKRYLVNIVYPL